jgi:hypothetical protein
MSLRQSIAERSLEWRDTDKVSFIWGEELVLAYVNRDYKTWYALTDLAPEDIQDINKWLGSYLQTLEEEEEAEEDERRALQSKLVDKKRNLPRPS